MSVLLAVACFASHLTILRSNKQQNIVNYNPIHLDIAVSHSMMNVIQRNAQSNRMWQNTRLVFCIKERHNQG